MEAFILRFIQDRTHSESATVPTENHREYLLLWGLNRRVLRFARAFSHLMRAGFAAEGKLIVRAALEHAVTAQWAYLTPGGVDRLNKAMAHSQHDLAKAVIPYSDTDEWLSREARAREIIPPGKAMPKFTGKGGIMAEVDSGHFLQATYSVLSQVGHVSHESFLDSLFWNEDGGVELIRDRIEENLDEELLYCMASFCLLSGWVLARLESNAAEITALQGFAKSLSVPYRLDQNLPAERRRFPNELIGE